VSGVNDVARAAFALAALCLVAVVVIVWRGNR
jgi:hypothetical protein